MGREHRGFPSSFVVWGFALGWADPDLVTDFIYCSGRDASGDWARTRLDSRTALGESWLWVTTRLRSLRQSKRRTEPEAEEVHIGKRRRTYAGAGRRGVAQG